MKASVLLIVPVDLDPSTDGDVAAVVRAGREAGAEAAAALRVRVPVTGEPSVVFAAMDAASLAHLLTLAAHHV